MENIIFCDGGLANRLNTLIFGLILKEKFGGKWAISWPINNWCGAKFDDLFLTDIKCYDNALNYYKKNENNFTMLMHENQSNFDEKIIIYNKELKGYDAYEEVLKKGKPILYYHNLIPSFVDVNDISLGLRKLQPNSEILIKAYAFCTRNKISNSVLGMHIRKTDFGNLVDDESLFKIALNSEHRFFVCSDDKKVTERFSELKNCIVYEKDFYPEKKNENGNWNSLIQDDQGRIYNFNVSRSSDSVCDALIDLMILSKTTQIHTSNSTFLKMAMIFKSTNYFSF
jgi:hypothetical protein